jgi:hypothetical protein
MDGGEPWNLCSGCDHVAVGFLERFRLAVDCSVVGRVRFAPEEHPQKFDNSYLVSPQQYGGALRFPFELRCSCRTSSRCSMFTTAMRVYTIMCKLCTLSQDEMATDPNSSVPNERIIEENHCGRESKGFSPPVQISRCPNLRVLGVLTATA